MSEQDLLSELVREAGEDHGLWIGLFASEPIQVCGDMVRDPHCTVIHLGKRSRGIVSAVGVSEACRAAEATSKWVSSLSRGAILSRIDGVARFSSTTPEGNPIVALLRAKAIRDLRDEVISSLSQGVGFPAARFQGEFGSYNPHVTLRRIPEAVPAVIHGTAGAPRPIWPEILWTHVGVTCGRAHGRWGL